MLSPPAAAVFVSGLVFLLITGLRSSGSLESLELAAYDWFIRLRPVTSASENRVVIIGITEEDIRKQDHWPLTDATLAQTLGTLVQYEPRSIGLDVFRDISVPPGSHELDSVLSENHNIIVVTKFGEGGVQAPPVLKNTDQVGFNDIIVDPGGIVRRGILFLDDGETVFYSFDLRLALLYLQAEGIVPQSDPSNPQHIMLGQTTIKPFEANDGGYVGADARGYQFLLEFQDARGSIPSFPLTALLAGQVEKDTIKDKVVFVGFVAESVKDFFYTPRSRGFKAAQQIQGVVLHANIVSELLRFALDGNSPIVTMSERQEALWILLWTVMGSATGLLMGALWRFFVVGLGGILILFFSAYFAFLHGWWIPLVPPAAAWVGSAALVTAYMSNLEKRQRGVLMHLFSRHVSPEVAESIWQQRDHFLNDGRPRSQELVVTVMFSDLKGFTSVSERMDPQSLIDWLNTYMDSMARLVMEYGGVVDDYAGDSIKANFGVPLPRTSRAEISKDAVDAVNCALAMEKEIHRLNTIWQEHSLPTVGIRIGIFTGAVVAGAVGSSQRLKYTTVGDTVNIAARLESYNKDFERERLCRILIGESTLNYLDNQFKTRRVGEGTLRGKDKTIIIHQILGTNDRDAKESM
jgi:adenylate cyclase